MIRRLFISIISLVNTILISIFERTSEIGVLKAIGAGPWDILKLIWTESILLGFFGWLIGIVLTLICADTVTYIITKILPYVPEGTIILIPYWLIIASFFSTIILGLLAGTYPALRASLMKPFEAIRKLAE